MLIVYFIKIENMNRERKSLEMYYIWRSVLVCGDIKIHNNNMKVGDQPTNGLTVMKTVYTEIQSVCGLPLFSMYLQETYIIEISIQE